MKFIALCSMTLILCSIKSYADDSYLINSVEHASSYNDLIIISSSINSLSLSPINEAPTKISGNYSNQLLSIEAGVVQSTPLANSNKYYFQGALTLHQYENFNVSLMANIEQQDNFYSPYLSNKKEQIPYNAQYNLSSETELSYGLVGSYTVNSTWQFSGGIIYAQPLSEQSSSTWYSNKNMALIGATYSF